ncbi:MAG TPA: hypothetical protein VFF40_07435 [Acidimicrobiia bacterium]|nr:hypothetical protein [Acidimicrobiia bacterium]
MTDVLDRVSPPDGSDHAGRSTPAAEISPDARSRVVALGRVVQWSVAALLLGAAAIHFASMGEHAGVSWTHGLFFAVIGWTQIALAALIVLRPSRAVALSAVVINAAVLGVWLVSRTAGITIGGDGTPEAWGWADGLAAGFEIAVVLVCLALFARGAARRPVSRGVGVGTAGFVGVLVVALTAWFFTPAVAGGTSANGHDHGESAAAGHSDDHSAETVDDKGLSGLSNGHHDAIGPEEPLDTATRQQLARQIAITAEVAAQYPTVASAMAAGYTRAGPYGPGLGAHYTTTSGPALNVDGVVDENDLRHPLGIIYDGTDPDSLVAGFMYYSMSKTEPEGFAGPNDVWHIHNQLCLKFTPEGVDSPFGADGEATKAQCDQVGGTMMKQTQWMTHVWSVPGWESQQGLFGEVNPALTCSDGTYYRRAPKDWVENLLDVCRSAPV